MDKLIKDVILYKRTVNRLTPKYKYVGELLVIDEERLLRIWGIRKKTIARINDFLVDAGYGCVGSLVGRAHELPAIVLRHMADQAEADERKKREENEGPKVDLQKIITKGLDPFGDED